MPTEHQLINAAIIIATTAHCDQKDKGGSPYILHPLRVMQKMETPQEQIVALLHDVVEDSDLELNFLLEKGFGEEIVHAVEAITKRAGENYGDYIERVIANPLALKVKIADLKDNLKIERIPHPTEKDFERMRKYQQTLAILVEIDFPERK